MSLPSHQVLLDRTFGVSLVLKGLNGVLELALGMLLLVLSPTQIDALTRLLTQPEIDEDPKDLLDTHLRALTAQLSVSASAFLAIYLLAHGIVKVVLVWAVGTGHVRAYPWMIATLFAFIGFQLYEMSVHFTIGLVLLTLFDVLIICLTWREYRIKRASRGTARFHKKGLS